MPTDRVLLLLADLTVVVHLVFVLFVIFGGVLLLWRKSAAWFHAPAVFWAALVEFAGWVCPLTPLENWLRERGGAAGYQTGFVERYLIPILYPSALTRKMQITLGLGVLLVNTIIYALVLGKLRRSRE